ncbi:MAG: glucosaminidase domain-containing protein [Gammaproteobacteria bacterium]|nr:glucosaminidase domain-containing protein [Gammaproteobacteria bacterium]
MNKTTATSFAAFCLFAIAVTVVYLPATKVSLSTSRFVNTQQTNILNFDSIEELNNYFLSVNYQWPIKDLSLIPGTLVRSMPDDIGTIKDSKARKRLFIRIMLPIIRAEQQRIRNERRLLQLALQSSNIKNATKYTTKNTTTEEQLNTLFKEYKINAKLNFEEKSNQLLKRFDELPLTLVLAQAAIESGWGTSRFTRVGNSLFGEWTYQEGAGIVPEDRDDGKSHKIKAFPSLRDSIASYIKNINRNSAYKELRQYRYEMRLQQQTLDSRTLAKGLHRYSQKGEGYVVSLLQILNSSEFKQIESLVTEDS